MTEKKTEDVQEMKKLLGEQHKFVPKITGWLIEQMCKTKLPTPVFWYFVLNSALRVIRQNLDEELYRETVQHCSEEQNDFVKKNPEQEELH
ncbi:MAG: hypothetical protein GOVbin4691_52 [Prokaryotic dsDNA virus sp.]|mgnify:CR=1 FL=1|jgi:hypothetical protein|nr:hypothetical protein [Candidatus Pacearchaeota archaeon]QDP52560.1 MAG: hypothetical protein GOVbin4691_52 [Prokaryotic dsDNA virus sp.]|tara:strand:- start:6070 stop:6342 length:273 start_codon:yes stop_codon:yes gene_type:complete